MQSEKTVLITGAAGRIGSACAFQSIARGYNVILVDINEDRLQTLRTDLNASSSSRSFAIRADVSSMEGIRQMLHEAQQIPFQIKSAIHCAYPVSEGWGTPFEDVTEENLLSDLKMQLGGAIMFSQQIIKMFIKQGGGNLVHMSSIQGIRAPKFDHYAGTNMTSPLEYSAIKAGVIAATKWLARYYTNVNVRINCVSPGGILDSQPKAFLDRYRQSCSNIGMLSSENVASAALYLISDEARAINGHNLVVDDGWSL